ncbi:MAG: helix-turn-helix domain-containing protein [Bacteroidota bacterium]
MPDFAASFRQALAHIEHTHVPQSLIEDRVTYGAGDAEFALYQTFYPAERVPLQASNPLFCGMIEGKKRIHTVTGAVIPFLPEESLVIPSGQPVYIDFPEASTETPTTCLTIEIDRARVHRVVQRLNERLPRSPDSGPWTYTDAGVCHLPNTAGLERALQDLTYLFVEDHPDKEALIDLRVQALVLRLLRSEAHHVLVEHSRLAASRHGLAAAVEYAKQHLHRTDLTVADLASQACMSEATFYRHFGNELGQTPTTFLTELRMQRACALLTNLDRSVTDTARAVGFASTSHFIQLFKAYTGQSPKQYQQTHEAASNVDP